MKAETGYFITSIPMVEIQESTYIPSVLFYQDARKPLIDFEAKAASESSGRDFLNEDFKIDLGNENPKSDNKRRFKTGGSLEKTAGDLSGDFLHQVILSVEEWLENSNISEKMGVVIAEPLIIQDENDKKDGKSWLANYRDNVRRILLGRNFKEDQINFLPEPFAVFQYYKYGVNHPLLGASKQYALVVDFGGGSFDTCIIETDKQGEITGKSRNTSPRSSLSIAAGGYHINRKIAEHLFFKYAKDEKTKTDLKKGLEVYKDWRERNKDISNSKTELQNFARNFHNTIYQIEDPKIMLCKNIYNWDIDADINVAVPLKFPQEPFSDTPNYFNANLTAEDFKKVFQFVWKEKLEPNIRKVFLQAKEDLKGAPITVILLSGGSCNIKWLEKLIYRDFPSQLNGVPILPLKDDFQEVVAKGLAIECARRFYDPNNSGEGDFTSVTYNKLNLVLEPDEKGYQLKVFTPTKENPIPAANSQCVLLPSASSLRNLFDKPLQWKVKLDRPPRRILDYYFLRSGFSPYKENLDNENSEFDSNETKYSDDLLNLSHTVYTPSDCNFDNNIHVELTIGKETKTAKAKFIYRMGTSERDRVAVEGKPFYLDMTDTQDNPTSKAYLGLDFGTSNTSVSFINQRAIQTYQKRASERSWLDLKDLCMELPYPLGSTLAKYIRETDKAKMITLAREFVESALALSAYVSYLDMCAKKTTNKTKYLGGFQFRSVGPLWKLLQKSINEVGSDAYFASGFRELANDFDTEMQKAVDFFNDHKHEKQDDAGFDHRFVEILANIGQKVFSKYSLGFFENVQPQRGGVFNGIFRVAHGNNTNFVDSKNYVGKYAFIPNELYLVDFEEKVALPLEPLMFWYKCEKHTDEHCYLFDSEKKGVGYSYKAAGISCQLLLSATHSELGSYTDTLTNWRKEDSEIELINF